MDNSGLECLTINTKLSKPEPNVNKTVAFYGKMTLQPPPPPTQTECQKNLSCNGPILMKL